MQLVPLRRHRGLSGGLGIPDGSNDSDGHGKKQLGNEEQTCPQRILLVQHCDPMGRPLGFCGIIPSAESRAHGCNKADRQEQGSNSHCMAPEEFFVVCHTASRVSSADSARPTKLTFLTCLI